MDVWGFSDSSVPLNSRCGYAPDLNETSKDVDGSFGDSAE